jgi:hypothetical protein
LRKNKGKGDLPHFVCSTDQKTKAACLFGQAAVSALFTAIQYAAQLYLLQSGRLLCITGSRHSCPLEIKQAICFFHSACLCLQHCLAFPFRACGPFFLPFNLTSPLLFVIKLLV